MAAAKQRTKALPLQPLPARSLPPFLHLLPAELRNDIYDMVMTKKRRSDLSTVEEDAFAQASRRFPYLRAEILSYVFSDCQFSVDVFSDYDIICKSAFPGSGGRQRYARHGPGRLAMPLNHWTFGRDLDLRIRSIAFRIVDPSGLQLIDVYFTARPARRDEPASANMTVRTGTYKFVKSDLADVIKEARVIVSTVRKEPGFAGFSMQHLQQLAACFECGRSRGPPEKKPVKARRKAAAKDKAPAPGKGISNAAQTVSTPTGRGNAIKSGPV